MIESAKLSHTDLVVSRLAFGCEPLGGVDWGQFDMRLAVQAVEDALDFGVNFFDTADVYGLGRSERILSAALRARRHDAIILSKFGVNWQASQDGGRARTFLDSSPRRVVEALEASLRRLRIDCIPLYLVHWPDPRTPIAATMDALVRCREAGKIEHIGVSNFPAPLIRTAHRLAGLALVELSYSLLGREAEKDVFPCCQELGISVLAYGVLGQGLLTGKYGPGARFGSNDRRSRLECFHGEHLAQNLKLVDRLRAVGRRYGKTPAQVAIRWVLDHPAVTAAIIGIKSSRQLEENLGAMNWLLEANDWEYLAQRKEAANFEGGKYVSETKTRP